MRRSDLTSYDPSVALMWLTGRYEKSTISFSPWIRSALPITFAALRGRRGGRAEGVGA